MSSIERLVKFLDTLKVSQGLSVNKSIGTPVGGKDAATSMGYTLRSSISATTEQFLEQTAAVASTISQGPALLSSKKEPGISKKEKQLHCEVVTEVVLQMCGHHNTASIPSSGDKIGGAGIALTTGVETLLLLADDAAPDVRITADEALNKLVRGVNPVQLARVLVEQMRDKTNSPVRVLRAALSRFAVIAKHIRVQKGRAYMQALVPLLCTLADRPEESLHESIATAMGAIFPALGYFTSDNEVKLILAAYQCNLSSASASIRRAAASALLSLCKHCRKPIIFLGCLVSLLLKSLVPISPTVEKNKVLGVLCCLRLTAPELHRLCPSSALELLSTRSTNDLSPSVHNYQGLSHSTKTFSVSIEQLLQVYQLSLHYCQSTDHNVVTASLELMKALLEHAPVAFVNALVSPGGVARCYVTGTTASSARSLSSRTSSVGSIGGLPGDDDMSLEPEYTASGGMLLEEHSMEGSITLKVEDKGGGRDRLGSIEQAIEAQEYEEEHLDDGSTSGKDNKGNDTQQLFNDDNLYSSIEVGKLSAEEDEDVSELLFDDGTLGEELSPRSAKEHADNDDVASAEQLMPDIAELNISLTPAAKGNVGSAYGSGVAGAYLVRFICSKFLLAGHSGSLLGDRTVRVSAKVLALNCLTKVLVWLPEMMEETVFIMDDGEGSEMELVQRVWDTARFTHHSDPSVCGAAAVLLGHYLRSASLAASTSFNDSSTPSATQQPHATDDHAALRTQISVTSNNNPVSAEAILNIFAELLASQSAVTARGAVAGVMACYPSIVKLQPVPPSAILSLLPHILAATRHKYWLVRVEACVLLSELPLCYIDFMEDSSSLNHSTYHSINGHFSHRVLKQGLFTLLPDSDQRVRLAAVKALVKLLPQLMLQNEQLIKNSIPNLTMPGFILSHNMTHDESRSVTRKIVRGLDGSPFNTVPPYDLLMERCEREGVNRIAVSLDNECPQIHRHCEKESSRLNNSSDISDSVMPVDLKKLRESNINDNLSRIIEFLSNTLLLTQEKHMKTGCVQALAELSEAYHPVLYGRGWGCHQLQLKSSDQAPASGLLTQVLALTKDMSLAGDLPTHTAIITVACNVLAGIGVCQLQLVGQQTASGTKVTRQSNRTMFSVVMDHVTKVLTLYWHVLENTPPRAQHSATQLSLNQQDNASPLKRKQKPDAVEKTKTESTGSGEHDTGEKDKKSGWNSSSKLAHKHGSFAHLPEYFKLYDVIRSAYNNFKISVCVMSEEKLCSVLRATLNGLCCVLEVLHTNDIVAPLEQLLQCCTTAMQLLPQQAILSAQQLIKCLFGNNMSCLHYIFPYLLSATPPSSMDTSSLLNSFTIELPLAHIKQELSQLKEGLLHYCCRCRSRHSGGSKREGNGISGTAYGTYMTGGAVPPLIGGQGVRPTLISYIRLFEPLVISALNSYTSTNSIPLQKAVLELVVVLVSIKVNYGLLDSNHVFLRYVIKQFEFIEEGHLRSADVLIPSMFEFLIAISYERQQSRNIMSVPKIIQLCDGLLASGRPPLSHCVLALGPLVDEVFGCSTAIDGGETLGSSLVASPENSELATKREVLGCTLLKLAHYHQVISLIGVMLCGARHEGPQQWRDMSVQVSDVILPLLSCQQINLHSQAAVSAVLEVLSSLCPTVFSQPDSLLRALFSTPSALESSSSVEVWVSGVVVLLRLLLSRSSPHIIFSRLTELGLSVQYLGLSGPSSPTPPPSAPSILPTAPLSNFSPLRRRIIAEVSSSPKKSPFTEPVNLSRSTTPTKAEPCFSDPLNVTQSSENNSTSPEAAIASFLFEVLRVCAYEVRTVWCIRLQEGERRATSSDLTSDGTEEHNTNDEHFLAYLAHQLLLSLVWIVESDEWSPIAGALRIACDTNTALLNEVCDQLLSVKVDHPYLALLCCRLHRAMDLPGQSVWQRVLRSQQRVTPASSPNNFNTCSALSTSSLGPSACLPLQLLRHSGVLLFSTYVAAHLCEEEWLAWVLVHHASDVVAMYRQPSVSQLLHAVHANAPASALLLHALNTRGTARITRASQGVALLSTVSKVHVSQSGTLVVFLLQEMLNRACLLHVRADVADVLIHRLKVVLAPQSSSQTLEQITLQQLAPFVRKGKWALRISRKFPELASLLEEVFQRLMRRADDPKTACKEWSHLAADNTEGLSWFMKLVCKRCSIDSGCGVEESCLLLLKLEANELTTVMSRDNFDVKLLAHALQYGLHYTLQGWTDGRHAPVLSTNTRSVESSPNNSSSSNTSSVSSSCTTTSSGGGEHQLYTAAKSLLLQQLHQVSALLSKPHTDYRPMGGNKYSERINQLLQSKISKSTNITVGERVEHLAPAITEYVSGMWRVPWRVELTPQDVIALLRVLHLMAEYIQWLLHNSLASIGGICSLLQCSQVALGSTAVLQRISKPELCPTVCALVSAIHATVTHFIAPDNLPQLPGSLQSEMQQCSGSVAVTAGGRVMQLVHWLEDNGHRTLPPTLASVCRSLIMSVGRSPCINSIVRCPPELWHAGWCPSLASCVQHPSSPSSGAASSSSVQYVLPPIPTQFLQEPHILKQFVFRAQLFGWLNKQQFEETWMALLSVLSAGSESDDSESQEQIYRNQSICICVRALSGLLQHTCLQPTPGDPALATVRRQQHTASPPASKESSDLMSVLRELQYRSTVLSTILSTPPSSELLQPYMEMTAAAVAANIEGSGQDRTPSPVVHWDNKGDTRAAQLRAMGVDIFSCTHFLHELFDAWLNQGKSSCPSITSEVCKCLYVLVDLLSSEDQFLWLLLTCCSLHAQHPTEDHTTHAYIILAASKSLAVCRAALISVGQTQIDVVLSMLDLGLKSSNISVRTCTLKGILHLLQAEQERFSSPLTAPTSTGGLDTSTENVTKMGSVSLGSQLSTGLPRNALSVLAFHIKPVSESSRTSSATSDMPPSNAPNDTFLSTLVHLASPYVVRACDACINESELQTVAAWDVCLCLVEHYSSLCEASLPATALHLALSTAAANTTTPTVLNKVLLSVEHILRKTDCLQKDGTREVVLKLVMDLVQHGSPTVSLAALRLLITTLYSHRTRDIDATNEPEQLMQLMERLGAMFERIKTGYSHEARLISAVLGSCLLDLIPPSQVLNKVIMEYISSQQPQPHLLAPILFQVFERCMKEDGESLVQEWVLMSLGNFTRREPVSLAVWCVTVFLVAASQSHDLRAAFPSVVTWPSYQQYKEDPNHLLADHVELFCFAAADFASKLPSEQHKQKFRAVFSEAAASTTSPFSRMLSYLDSQSL